MIVRKFLFILFYHFMYGLVIFSPHNFPYENPIGAEIYNMIKDIARVYLLYELTSQGRFMRTNDDGSY